MKRILVIMVIAVLGLGLTSTFAQEVKKEEPQPKKKEEPSKPEEKLSEEELQKKIDELIKKLGDDSYKVRENATKELEKIGKPALGSLKKATESDDAEVSFRAKMIIKKIEERLYGKPKEKKEEESIPLPPGLPPNVKKAFKKIVVQIGPGGKLIPGGEEKKKEIAGATLGDISPALRKHLKLKEKEGVLIEKLKKDSLLAKAGVERYDIILKINDKEIQGLEAFKKIMEEVAKKDKVELKISIVREGAKKELAFAEEKEKKEEKKQEKKEEKPEK